MKISNVRHTLRWLDYHFLAEKDLLNRCEQCTGDRHFNLSENGGSTHLRGECHRNLVNTHLRVECHCQTTKED